MAKILYAQRPKGHTLEVGETTVHAASSQHRAVTLSSSDTELYEASRAAVFRAALRNSPVGDDVDLDLLARCTPGFSGADCA